MTTNTQNKARTSPSWLTRFWAIVRYEMLWNIRKKKFIGILIVAFVFATLGLALPPLLSNVTNQAVTSNPNYAVTFGAGNFGFFLFALATAMNSISSEFESGTIVPLLTKPVSRTMIFLGKLFAGFILILLTGTVLFAYGVIGGILVYGPQNNLELVPLAMLGNGISIFIWVAILLAIGAISKSTIVTALTALGLFLAFSVVLQIVPVFTGPSPALNFVPGAGATGTITISQNATLTVTRSVAAGTDNVGVNLINYILYPSATVNFTKLNLQAIQSGQPIPQASTVVYTEPVSLVAARSLGVAFAYILAFLFVAWFVFKRAQIVE